MKSPKSFGKQKKHRGLLVRRVHGQSMLPALHPDQLILARRRFGQLSVGDIIVVEHDGLEKIKRISNINEKGVYVRGDNVEHSTDSRSFGWLLHRQVIAKVIWPRNI